MKICFETTGENVKLHISTRKEEVGPRLTANCYGRRKTTTNDVLRHRPTDQPTNQPPHQHQAKQVGWVEVERVPSPKTQQFPSRSSSLARQGGFNHPSSSWSYLCGPRDRRATLSVSFYLDTKTTDRPCTSMVLSVSRVCELRVPRRGHRLASTSSCPLLPFRTIWPPQRMNEDGARQTKSHTQQEQRTLL